MNTVTEGRFFPASSAEALWEWHPPSDRITLSTGALQALKLSDGECPATMRAFLEHVPPASRAALQEKRRGVLNASTLSFLETSYPFEGMLVRERLVVLERDGQGRATRALGQCAAVGDSAFVTAPSPDESSGVGFWHCRLLQRSVRIDACCATLLGFTDAAPREVSLDDWKARLKNDDPMICRHTAIINDPRKGDAFEDIVQIQQESGEYAVMTLRGAVMERGADGRALQLTGSLRSVRNFAESGEQNTRESDRLLLAVSAAGDGLWDWDAQTDSVYYSPRYLSMLGYTAEEFPARLDVWEAKIHPDDYDKIVPPQRALVESPATGDTFECTYRLRKADGTWAWIMGRGYVTHRDASGKATRLVGLHTDVTAAQGDRAKLEELVKNDALTGLRSRTFCDLELERLESARIRPLSVISCDVNGLKLINDYMGHAAGDELLRRTAALLRRPLRLTDCVARMGGDEFLILLSGCNCKKAAGILRQIRRGLEEANAEGGIPVLLAFGLASTDDAAVPASKLLRDADRNMLRLKDAHRQASHRQIKNWIESKKNVAVSLEDSRYVG